LVNVDLLSWADGRNSVQASASSARMHDRDRGPGPSDQCGDVQSAARQPDEL